MTVLHRGPATASPAFACRPGVSSGPPRLLPAVLLAVGGESWLAVPALAPWRAGGGFTAPANLILLIGMAVLVVGFLLVFIMVRRSSPTGAGAPGPQPAAQLAGAQPAADEPSPTRPPLSEQHAAAPPLQQRRPMPPDTAFGPPDTAFGWTERGQEGPRHRVTDPPAPPMLSKPPMLSNQALLAGRVIGSDGHPVSGARLTVSDFHGRAVGVGHSATDGRYRLHLPTGGTYLLLCSAEGQQSTTVMVTVAAAALVCDVVLGGTGRIDGLVRRQHGTPAAAATVTLTDLRGEVVASTMADHTGGYRLAGLNAGEYTLVASAAGAQPSACTVQVPGSGVCRVDVVLQSNGALRGTVRAAGGARPVPDASVALVDGSGGVVAAVTTSANGEYAFAEVPPGRYALVASGYPPVATWIELTGQYTEVHDVMLGAGPERTGLVGTGAPGTLVGIPQPRADAWPERGKR